MQKALTGDRFSIFLIAKAGAAHLALNELLTLGDGGTQIFAQVETAIFAHPAGTIEMKQGLRCLQVCPIPETVTPGDDILVAKKEIHGQGF